MTFLEYLTELCNLENGDKVKDKDKSKIKEIQEPKEFKVLLTAVDIKYGWLATNCGGSCPRDLLYEMSKRCFNGKRKFPAGQITEDKARSYIVNSVIRSLVNHEYKEIMKERERVKQLDNMPEQNDRNSFQKTLASKDSDPSEQLQYEQGMAEIHSRVKGAYPRRQPRLFKVFELLVQGKSSAEIIQELNSNKSTIFEDRALIKSITEAYFQE